MAKSNAIENIKKLHSAMSIERKDISLKELVAAEADKKSKVLVMNVAGFASKYVPKYHNENNQGFHTMIYLTDGRKTGAFSNALYELAQFFYKGAGLSEHEKFNKIMFNEGGFIQIAVTVVELDSKKTTYNFEILDGNVDKGVETMGQISGGTLLLEG